MAVVEPKSEAPTASGSTVWRDYVREQVEREEARKESLERRALSVITSAGAFATVLFALAAFTINEDTFTLSDSAKVTLAIALGFLVVSALLAISINYPMDYQEVKPEKLRDVFTTERWREPQPSAEKKVALTEIDVLSAARDKNGTKAERLGQAVGAQAVAVAFVAATVFIIIL